MNRFSLANEEQIFIKKESVEGTLVYPSATDMVLAVGAAVTNQEYEFLEDGQVRQARSRSSPIRGRLQPGSWSFRTYVKPSGTLGTVPETDVLWECLMGGKDIQPSYVKYYLVSTSNLPSFSMVRKVGHTVFFIAGATVNQAEIGISGGEIAAVAWSGQFMSWSWAGTDTLYAQANNGASSITVTDAKRFSGINKTKIVIGTDDNSGSGYLITNINYSTNVISIFPTLGSTQNVGAVVRGWYPTNGVEVGRPVHGKLGMVTINGTTAAILSSAITINNNIKYYTDIKDGLMYPTVYGAPGFRTVQGQLRLYFYQNMPGYFYRAENQEQDALIVPAGSVSGSIMEVKCPQIEYRTPNITGDEELLCELNFTAVGETGDDEIEIYFK